MVRIELSGTGPEIMADMRAMFAPALREPPIEDVYVALDERDGLKEGAPVREEAFRLQPEGDRAAAPAVETIREAIRQNAAALAEINPPAGPELTLQELSAVVEAEQNKRKRRTKAEMEAARAAATAPAERAPDEPAAESARALPDATTFEDCKEALKDICEADGLGVEAAQKLLKGFGVARLSLLAPDQYGDFHAAAACLIAGKDIAL